MLCWNNKLDKPAKPPRCSFHQRIVDNKLENRILVVPIIIDIYASIEVLVFETHFNIVKAEVKTFESSKLETIQVILIGMIIRFAYHCSKFHGNVRIPIALPVLEIVPCFGRFYDDERLPVCRGAQWTPPSLNACCESHRRGGIHRVVIFSAWLHI